MLLTVLSWWCVVNFWRMGYVLQPFEPSMALPQIFTTTPRSCSANFRAQGSHCSTALLCVNLIFARGRWEELSGLSIFIEAHVSTCRGLGGVWTPYGSWDSRFGVVGIEKELEIHVGWKIFFCFFIQENSRKLTRIFLFKRIFLDF